MPYKLLAAQNLKDLSKTDIAEEYDTLLDSIIIPAVGELLAAYCGRPDWDKAARIEYLSPNCRQRFAMVSSPPIASTPVVDVWDDGNIPRVYGTDKKLVNGTDYFVFESEGYIERLGYFTPGPKTVKVSYTGGYLTGDGMGAPVKLKLAAMMQTKIIFDRREEFGLMSRSLDGGSMSMLSILTLPRQVTMLIDDLRVLRV